MIRNLMMVVGILDYFYVRIQLVLIPLYILYIFTDEKKLRPALKYFVHKFLVYMPIAASAVGLLSVRPIGNMREWFNNPTFTIETSIGRNICSEILVDIAPLYITLGILSAIGLLTYMVIVVINTIQKRAMIRCAYVRKRYRSTVILTDNKIKTPCTFALKKNFIYLPERIYNDRHKVNIVTAHELQHIKKHHNADIHIELLNLLAFWFNPLTVYIYIKGYELREYICDEKICRRFSPVLYSRMLLEEAEQECSRKFFVMGNRMIGSRKRDLQKRIEYILSEKPLESDRYMIGGILFVEGIILMFLVNVIYFVKIVR